MTPKDPLFDEIEEITPRMIRLSEAEVKVMLQAGLKGHCLECISPGGHLHQLGMIVDKQAKAISDLAKKVDDLVSDFAARAGQRRLLAVLVPSLVVIACVFLAAFVNYKFAQLRELQDVASRAPHAQLPVLPPAELFTSAQQAGGQECCLPLSSLSSVSFASLEIGTEDRSRPRQ